jgi:uncharacterized repeat protein (TIGR04076 family)
MMPRLVRVEASQVRTESRVCPGIAQTEQGETYLLDGRTPADRGICCQAFTAMSALRMALMVTDEVAGERDGHLDATCPHGFVTFRLSRAG